MKTVDDLRTTLGVHAPGEDTALLDRAASVRARVHVVRRRRRVSAVVGAVVAVAVVAGGVVLPRLGEERGDGDLAAAATVTVGGFEYRLVRIAETRPGQDHLDVTATRTSADQAVALVAAGLGDGRATLRQASENPDIGSSDATAVDRIVGDGANHAVPLYVPDVTDDPDAGRYRLSVEAGTARTRVGVAFYERTSRMPKGIVDPTGTTVFRQQVGSRRLLDASFAKRGEAETTLAFTGRIDQMRLEGFCSVEHPGDGDKAPWINVAIDGDGPVSWGDCKNRSEDAGSGGVQLDNPAAGRHTVRVWASETVGGPPHAYPGLILGGAVYDDSAALVVHGSRVDPVVEFEGRRWQLDRDLMTQSLVGGHSLGIALNDPAPLLVGYAAESVRRVWVRVTGATSTGDTGSAGGRERGSMSSVGTILFPGGVANYALSWPAKDGGSAAILVYRPLD